jgi:hypothetical protein
LLIHHRRVLSEALVANLDKTRDPIEAVVVDGVAAGRRRPSTRSSCATT